MLIIRQKNQSLLTVINAITKCFNEAVESENIAGISFSTSSDLNKNNSEIKETTSTDDEEITCRQAKFLSFSEETTMQIFDIDISDDDEDDR